MAFSGHIPRKRFGQHWLKDSLILDKIVEAAEINSEDCVLEVGPGKGALTQRLLASKAASVYAIELDRDLVDGLRYKFRDENRFHLVEGDILSMSLSSFDSPRINKIVANIPYNITGPLLEKLLGRLNRPNEVPFDLLVLLMQREVADRILAKSSQSCFSALSIRMQLMAKCKGICEVPPSSFKPSPKVHSQVIAIKPFQPAMLLPPHIAARIDTLLRMSFLSRRKMLRNSLKGLMSTKELIVWAEQSQISLDKRPQELSIENWLSMGSNLDSFCNALQD